MPPFPDDYDPVELAKAGDKLAFEKLFLLYSDDIYRYLRYMIGNGEDARDLLQDTFLMAWKGLPRLRNPARFRCWLYRIAKNKALDYIQPKQLFRWLPWPEENDPDPPINIDEQSPHEWVLLNLALGKVKPKYRQCLILQDIHGRSQKEIAEIVGINPNSVSKYVTRGYKAIRKAYQYYDGLFRGTGL